MTHASHETLTRARRALADLLKESGESYPELAAASLLRRRDVEQRRQLFFDSTSDIIDALERASRRDVQRAADGEDRAVPIRSVDACWVNASIRTPAYALSVAGVHEDPRVKRVDVPRRLRREINATAPLVGAPAYRASHNVSGVGVIVAVIDTEIHSSHPSLTGRVFRKRNYISEEWDTTPATHPQAPHGTAVAGIIGSSAGLLGMAPAITFYNYKVLPNNELFPAGDDFDGAKAIEHSIHDGAHIANCSWRAIPDDDAVMNGQSREALACNNAWASGVVVVTSVGNEGPGSGSLTTPADADGVIAVGATNRTGTSVPAYSSRGPTAHGMQRPHLVAPGGELVDLVSSCTIFDTFVPGFQGTSFAAAHVSGLAALLLGRNPELTPDEVRAALIAMCKPLPGLDVNTQGSGLISIV
ncbi:MAG TPA: S8 family serine peptidase [Vicinamibacterales bacterium]|jgi:serine protease AprX